MQIALYQPDIALNLGAFIRLSACLATPLHVIEPCGFPLDERKIRRAAMDYYDKAEMIRHASWEEFLLGIRHWALGNGEASRPTASVRDSAQAHCAEQERSAGAIKRIILLTTKAAVDYRTVEYRPDDILLLGRESAGVPDEVHEAADLRVMIPMAEGCRSLNVTLAAAIVLGRALSA